MAGEPLEEYAIKSYRYLRLAIVVVVLSLVASVVIERWKTSCWEVSISAYFYTPVHAMFVGALVAIGVCLIAVKGSRDWEDMLLNVAGILAPVVAFVPTSPPSRSCSSSPFGAVDAEAYLDNNVLAYAIGGIVAIGGAWIIAGVQKKDDVVTRSIRRRSTDCCSSPSSPVPGWCGTSVSAPASWPTPTPGRPSPCSPSSASSSPSTRRRRSARTRCSTPSSPASCWRRSSAWAS